VEAQISCWHLSRSLPGIPIVYSTTIGLISPQFHVVFDDKFSTVKCLHNNKVPSNWPELFNIASTFYVDEDFSKTNFYPQALFDNQSSPPVSSSFERENIPSSSLPSELQRGIEL